MKVLFDNNVPAPLRHRLLGHEIHTARQMGWHELKNGELLTTAEAAGFEVMVTGDKNLSYQQNLTGRNLALVVLPTISWKTLQQDTAPVTAAVDKATPGSFQTVMLENQTPRRRKPNRFLEP